MVNHIGEYRRLRFASRETFEAESRARDDDASARQLVAFVEDADRGSFEL